MPFACDDLRKLLQVSDQEAWGFIVERTLQIAAAPLSPETAPSEVKRRDSEIGEMDLFLSSCGWELWHTLDACVERTSDSLIRWWNNPFDRKAVLILDGLSLRELPWLLQGASANGFTIYRSSATASELPGDTDAFAHALGFPNRSKLQNKGGGQEHKLQPASTESVNLPWEDCEGLIDVAPNQIFWHHWPDAKLHDNSGLAKGLEQFSEEMARELYSSYFWAFVKRLATGRRLVITSDHGYAATESFRDEEGEVGKFLKQTFSSGRIKRGAVEPAPFAPPVSLQINNSHGAQMLALGRRKWRSQGGYPKFTHGGLSLLEVLSPWVELSNTGAT